MPLLILFLAVPAGEIFVFIEVGGIIGAWPTVGIIFGTAIVGGSILRWQGLRTLARAREQLARNKAPVAEMAEGASLAVAALLLLTPGFFTDALGTILLFPIVRRALIRAVLRRVARHMDAARARRDGGPAAGGATIIDGEYHEVDENDDPQPPTLTPWKRR